MPSSPPFSSLTSRDRSHYQQHQPQSFPITDHRFLSSPILLHHNPSPSPSNPSFFTTSTTGNSLIKTWMPGAPFSATQRSLCVCVFPRFTFLSPLQASYLSSTTFFPVERSCLYHLALVITDPTIRPDPTPAAKIDHCGQARRTEGSKKLTEPPSRGVSPPNRGPEGLPIEHLTPRPTCVRRSDV